MKLDRKFIKSILLRIIGFSMYYAGIYHVLDKLFKNKAVYMMMYHKIADIEDNYYSQDIAVKKGELLRQVEYFRRKYDCISMSEAVGKIANKEVLDRDYLVFTFDDGYMDNLSLGLDIYSKHNIKPIVYLTANSIENRSPIWTEVVDYILLEAHEPSVEMVLSGEKIVIQAKDKRDIGALGSRIKELLKKLPQDEIRMQLENMARTFGVSIDSARGELLDWEGIKALVNAGWEVGSHTMNHINLAAEAEDTVTKELMESGKLINERIGFATVHFAYPYGKESNYNHTSIEAVKRYYKSAVTTVEGINRPGDDIYLLKRIMVANHHSLMDIKIKLLKAKIMDFCCKGSS